MRWYILHSFYIRSEHSGIVPVLSKGIKKTHKFSHRLSNWILGAVLIALLIFLLIYKINDFPVVWWDEGWTLSAARNWIENGHLGNYLNGEPVPPRIPLRFPVAIPVTLSMKIFGMGIWQGRLPGVLFTLLSLSFYVFLTSKLYDFKTGVAAMVIVLCLSPYSFNPILMGRQILAEMPMMFYLLGGYVMVWLALNHHAAWGILASIFFGIAIHTKLQVPPFWLVSVILACWMAIIFHSRRLIIILIGIFSGSIAVAFLVYLAQNLLMPGSFADPELVKLLFNTSVLMPLWIVRWKAIYIIILFALAQAIGFIRAGRPIIKDLLIFKDQEHSNIDTIGINKSVLRAAIWGLGASWLLWYALMSMYWIRYLFPAYFIGCIYVSAYLGKITKGYSIRLIIQQASALLLKRDFKWENLQSATVILAISIVLGLSIGTLRIGLVPTTWNPELASTYLRNNIPTTSLVETYESELLFLAPELKYHFPPDTVSMQLYRRADIDNNYQIDYDALESEPNYLVIGPFASVYGLYKDLIVQGKIELEADVGGYQIYRVITEFPIQ